MKQVKDGVSKHYLWCNTEVLDLMLEAFSIEEMLAFCKLNAFKYRMRAGKKGLANRDIEKAVFYENYFSHLIKEKLVKEVEINMENV